MCVPVWIYIHRMCIYCLPNFSVILFLFRLQVSKNFWAIFVVAWIVSSSANFYSLVSGTVRKVPPWTNHLSDGTSNAFLCSSLLLLIARSLPQEALWFYLPPTHPSVHHQYSSQVPVWFKGLQFIPAITCFDTQPVPDLASGSTSRLTSVFCSFNLSQSFKKKFEHSAFWEVPGGAHLQSQYYQGGGRKIRSLRLCLRPVLTSGWTKGAVT